MYLLGSDLQNSSSTAPAKIDAAAWPNESFCGSEGPPRDGWL